MRRTWFPDLMGAGVLVAVGVLGVPSIQSAAAVAADTPTVEQHGTDNFSAPNAEPDYESEKLQFQRGSLMLYTLPQLDADLAPFDRRNPRAAALALQRLVDQAGLGKAFAMVLLGLLHERGQGVEQDYHEAAAWYRKAAAAGSAQASFLLGMVYWQGKGVPQDREQAALWMHRAAAQGLLAAQVDSGWLCEYAPAPAQDFACARDWYMRAARAGDATGAFDLGSLYYQGKGVRQDYVIARHWFLQAAARGHAGAQYNLGVLALGDSLWPVLDAAQDGSQGGQAHTATTTAVAPPDPVSAYQWFRLVEIAGYPGASQSVRRAAAWLDARQIAQAELSIRHWQATHPPIKSVGSQ